MTDTDNTYETRTLRWMELIIEDSFNAEMTEQQFAAACTTLIYHLNAHIDAAKPLVTPEDIARENRNDDMASWLGVKR
jgi:hypothetical protein